LISDKRRLGQFQENKNVYLITLPDFWLHFGLYCDKTLNAVMKKFISTLTVCVMLASVCKAQDPNFSQFFSSPLTLNPALTGKFDGAFRLAGNFRNQWPTINNAYVTRTASIDFGILKNRLSDIDQLGVGILGVTDRAGDGVLVTNYAGLSLAYHKDWCGVSGHFCK
jgi:Type IX secretion system membrane protein PorP/SprF